MSPVLHRKCRVFSLFSISLTRYVLCLFIFLWPLNIFTNTIIIIVFCASVARPIKFRCSSSLETCSFDSLSCESPSCLVFQLHHPKGFLSALCTISRRTSSCIARLEMLIPSAYNQKLGRHLCSIIT